MLPRQINLDKIQKYLMNIESDIQTNNYCRFYDINIISESFCCDLLNKSFELNLENTNLFKRNQKAIDLVDKKSGIAIQITSEKSLNKIIQETLEQQYYCVISGESGCGKSISAYQVGYRYYKNGWKVYRYLNNNKFDYKIFSQFKNKTILIIDDAQVLENFQIERIISNINKSVRVIITITDAIVMQDDSVRYITNQESIKKLSEEYLKRKAELYPILRKIDKDIDDRYMRDTIESRIELASKQKTPWLFNFVLRGGWNKARIDFKRIKERNEAHKLLVILSFLQLLYIDKAISKLELLKNCEIWDKDYEWFENNLKYLIENKIIIEEYNKYRCAHIRYADFFTSIFIDNCSKEELECILRFLRKVVVDENYSLQGISWVLHNIEWYGQGYYIRNNLLKDKELDTIVNRCFSSNESLDVRNALLVLNELDRYNEKILVILEKEKYLEKIAYWIENVNEITGYTLSRIINDYFINKQLNSRLLFSYINIDNLIETINKCNYKAIWHISNLIERLLYSIKDKKISSNIISAIDVETLANKINDSYCDMYLDEIVEITGVINLYDEDKAIKLYKETKECIKYYFKKDALKAYESIDNHFLWMFLGYSFFTEKQPKEKYRKIAKEILSFIDIKEFAIQISNTNLHDMERYARFFRWINIVDISVAKRIVKLIDYNKIDKNMKEHLKKTPSELGIFIYSIGTSKEKRFFEWMDRNVKNIEFAEPMISTVYPKVVENCIENSYEIDIFGDNNSFDGALLMIITLNEYSQQLCLKVLEISIDKIIKRMSNLCYSIDFSEKNMTYNFLNYIRKNYVDIFNKIISSLDVEKVKNNMKENYNKIIKDNDKRKNKMIKELKKIANIYKHNSELKCFCDDLIS